MINFDNQQVDQLRYPLGIEEATSCHDKKPYIQIKGLEKYSFIKTNEKGFEDSLLFDVTGAKNEINGNTQAKVTVFVSYEGIDAKLFAPTEKVIDLKLIGNPCQLIPKLLSADIKHNVNFEEQIVNWNAFFDAQYCQQKDI